MVVAVITKVLMIWLMGGIEDMNSYQWNLEINDLSDFEKLNMSFDYKTLVNIAKIILISIPLICWLAAYFRLKTRQI